MSTVLSCGVMSCSCYSGELLVTGRKCCECRSTHLRSWTIVRRCFCASAAREVTLQQAAMQPAVARLGQLRGVEVHVRGDHEQPVQRHTAASTVRGLRDRRTQSGERCLLSCCVEGKPRTEVRRKLISMHPNVL